MYQQQIGFLKIGDQKFCQVDDHDGEQCVRICTYDRCDQIQKVLCGHCIINHSSHSDFLVKIQEFSIESKSKFKKFKSDSTAQEDFIKENILTPLNQISQEIVDSVSQEIKSKKEEFLTFLKDQKIKGFHDSSENLDQLSGSELSLFDDQKLNFLLQTLWVPISGKADANSIFYKEKEREALVQSVERFQQDSQNLNTQISNFLNQLFGHLKQQIILISAGNQQPSGSSSRVYASASSSAFIKTSLFNSRQVNGKPQSSFMEPLMGSRLSQSRINLQISQISNKNNPSINLPQINPQNDQIIMEIRMIQSELNDLQFAISKKDLENRDINRSIKNLEEQHYYSVQQLESVQREKANLEREYQSELERQTQDISQLTLKFQQLCKEEQLIDAEGAQQQPDDQKEKTRQLVRGQLRLIQYEKKNLVELLQQENLMKGQRTLDLEIVIENLKEKKLNIEFRISELKSFLHDVAQTQESLTFKYSDGLQRIKQKQSCLDVGLV